MHTTTKAVFLLPSLQWRYLSFRFLWIYVPNHVSDSFYSSVPEKKINFLCSPVTLSLHLLMPSQPTFHTKSNNERLQFPPLRHLMCVFRASRKCAARRAAPGSRRGYWREGRLNATQASPAHCSLVPGIFMARSHVSPLFVGIALPDSQAGFFSAGPQERAHREHTLQRLMIRPYCINVCVLTRSSSLSLFLCQQVFCLEAAINPDSDFLKVAGLIKWPTGWTEETEMQSRILWAAWHPVNSLESEPFLWEQMGRDKRLTSDKAEFDILLYHIGRVTDINFINVPKLMWH